MSSVNAPTTEQVRRTKLAALIESSKIRPIDVARALHVNPSTVHFWMNGIFHPRAANLIDLCNYFDVDPEEVIGYVEENAIDPAIEAKR